MTRRRALVLDADSRTALAAVRALGRAGFEVGTMTTFGDALASHSRYAVRHHVPEPGVTLGESIDALADEHGYEVALAAKEFTLAALLAHAPRTPTVPTLGRPLVALSDKLELADVAAAADVRYPATGVAGTRRGLLVPADGQVVPLGDRRRRRARRRLERREGRTRRERSSRTSRHGSARRD